MPDATAPLSLGVPLGERGELRPHDRNRAAKRRFPLYLSGPPSLLNPHKTLASGPGGILRAGCVNDPVGFLAADAPAIASLRRGATCAEAEKIKAARTSDAAASTVV